MSVTCLSQIMNPNDSRATVPPSGGHVTIAPASSGEDVHVKVPETGQ